jgi:hypothetical protein
VLILLYTVPMKTTRDISLDAASSKSIACEQISRHLDTQSCTNRAVAGHFVLRNLIVLGIFVVVPFSASVSATVAAVQASAPSLYASPLSSGQNPFPDPFHGMDDISRQQFQKELKALNIERQKQLTSDSVKLLALAAELKAEVDKAGNSDPTPEQLRKADQIEKLAHSIRDKMKDANSPAEPMMPMRRK